MEDYKRGSDLHILNLITNLNDCESGNRSDLYSDLGLGFRVRARATL